MDTKKIKEEEKGMARTWEPTTVEVDSTTLSGNSVKLEEVTAEKSGEEIRFDIDDLLKAEQESIANTHGIKPRNIHELLLLYATTEFDKGGYIEQKYRFNKMVFYHKMALENAGYGDSYIYNKIVSAGKGPIPIDLKEDMVELQEKGIVKISATRDNKQISEGKEAVSMFGKHGISMKCELTPQGIETAESLWKETPDEVKATTIKVKKDLFFIDAGQLKDKVHKEYPEYKNTYETVDAE